MTDEGTMDDLMWLQLDLAIMKHTSEDMIDGIPLGKQITDDHIRLGIRDWFADVEPNLEIEVVEAMLTKYKDYMAQRQAVEKFCMNILEAIAGPMLGRNFPF